MAVSTYQASAVREGNWWLVTVPAVPGAFSQVRRLNQVEDAIREAIAFVAQIDQADVEVQVKVDLPDGVLERAEQSRAAVHQLEQAQRDAAALSRDAARALVDAGLSGYDVATVLGVSPQRVSQLINAA